MFFPAENSGDLDVALIGRGPDESFDRVARLAGFILGAPIAYVAIVDRDKDRLWFTSVVGMELKDVAVADAFCRVTLELSDTLVVDDATRDDRFAADLLVSGQPHLRFYAGTPLRNGDGTVLGTLCVLDTVPHHPTPAQVQALKDLSFSVVAELDLRRTAHRLKGQIEAERHLAADLERERARLEDFLAASSKQLWETDSALRLTFIGGTDITQQAPQRLLGRALDEALSNSAIPERVRATFKTAMEARQPFSSLEYRRVLPDGQVLWVEQSGKPVFAPDGTFQGYRGTASDITPRKIAEETIRRQAEEDALTGLANRRLFERRLDEVLKQRGESALLLIDVDHFKAVNDTFGHETGDALMRAIARLIESCVRLGDTVARIGGDEFAVILEDCSAEQAAEVAARLGATLKIPVALGSQRLKTSLSLGAVLLPRDGGDRETALRHADLALYRSKREGRARTSFFSPGDNANPMHNEAA